MNTNLSSIGLKLSGSGSDTFLMNTNRPALATTVNAQALRQSWSPLPASATVRSPK